MMDATTFYERRTMWELAGKPIREQYSGGWKQYYSEKKTYLEKNGASDPSSPLFNGEIDSVYSEYRWCESGRPYYKLWPGYAAMLLKTRLDIPVDAVRFPHDAFCIRLSKEHPIRLKDADESDAIIETILVSHAYGVSPLTGHQGPLVSIIANDPSQRHYSLAMYLNHGGTIQECYEASTDRQRLGMTRHEGLREALQLAMAVTMLAVSAHRCVEHDVLAALRERYDAAKTDEERQELAERSERKGIKGWNIGRGRCLSLTTQHGEQSEGGGRELSYQHVRGGHFHTVLHGKGRQERKVVFFEPTIVRPDLPVAPVFAMS